MFNINYAYEKDQEGNNVLLGATINTFDGTTTIHKGIYVGIPFTLDDILSKEINASLFDASSISIIKEKYQSIDAKGIVYFPQTENYAFLEENEEVILWNGNESIEILLENALKPFKNRNLNEEQKSLLSSKKKQLIEMVDPENPFAEYYNLKLKRQVSSR